MCGDKVYNRNLHIIGQTVSSLVRMGLNMLLSLLQTIHIYYPLQKVMIWVCLFVLCYFSAFLIIFCIQSQSFKGPIFQCTFNDLPVDTLKLINEQIFMKCLLG